ncbi:heterokaryon incompatibility protein-domain-containing protein [Schizothecium vesticola]|uniref:Heterokaryon incompatibility protein-domain-containing protein n=1 Tax=Schizothecium vesticola TaxID=314040 RepID=A0AA40K5J6_9PEZI|nr:heterokaryon incompatibility protein-domain-containing protein [Schizothecium vesticola]
MRLINTETLEIQDHGDRPPPYAILSHAWGPEEVTFQDCTPNPHKTSSKFGFAKFKGACAQARKDGYDHLWIDTNCIDKTSSTELYEAINSMFKWYDKAHRCYAYLSDVADDSVYFDKSGTPKVTESFRRSKWFTRGWTLQELLAPRDVVFFSRNWQRLGTKLELQVPLSEITFMPIDYLVNKTELRAASVAQRMSWMSKRETTQPEDMAYSILGIFGIFIPIIYGEGIHAFLRLQKAIMEKNDDHSIFCWEWDHTVDPSWASVFAPSPRAFANSAKYSPKPWSNGDIATPYHIRNGGLSIALPLVQTADPSVVLAMLDVEVYDGERNDFQVGIPLQIGPMYQRLPFPLHPVQVNGNFLAGEKNVLINTTENGHGHRLSSRLLADQENQSSRLFSDLQRAARARVGFFLAFHLDGCEIEHISTQPGVELIRTVSMVAFIDPVAGSDSSTFMATALKIKHKTIGETVVLLATMTRQGSGYLFFSQALPPNRRRTKESIDSALAKLRERSAREDGDKSYQSGRELCVTMGGSFPLSGNGGPTVKTVQVWVNKAAKSINPVQRVRAGLLGLKRTLSRS